MTPAARLSAAMEVIADLEARRRPAGDALKDWGLTHRFAGSSDRAGDCRARVRRVAPQSVVGVADGEASPRAAILGMLRRERGLDVTEIAGAVQRRALCARAADRGGAESAGVRGARRGAAGRFAGDYPDWLDPHFARVFGDERAAQGAALASRAPLDLRVNTLKAEREEVVQKLAHLNAEPTRWSPHGLRIKLGADAKNPAIHAEPCFRKGEIEIQDEGSQLAALFALAKPGEQVLDLAAGAGGKTLALAAAMENRGQIYATDIDKRQLAPIHERIARAGARNIQVRTPRGEADVIADLAGRIDCVLIDAPCTGTGAWRRSPDAKWRVRPGALEERREAAGHAARSRRGAGQSRRPHRLRHLLGTGGGERRPNPGLSVSARKFRVVSPAEVAAAALGERAMLFCRAARLSGEGLLMTPLSTGTDGFYVAVMRKG